MGGPSSEFDVHFSTSAILMAELRKLTIPLTKIQIEYLLINLSIDIEKLFKLCLALKMDKQKLLLDTFKNQSYSEVNFCGNDYQPHD